jgi:hypothetical protein
MNYWLDLFTGTTWEEFRQSGARITGFRARMRATAKKVKSGDVFLCYLTGVMRWVGALEVVSSTNDGSLIWKDEIFPVRFEVRPLILLNPEHGVPMQELRGKVAFYSGQKDEGKFKGFVRMSPNLFRKAEDAQFILSLLRQAEIQPVARPVDPKKLARKPLYSAERRKGRTTLRVAVSVPDSDEKPPEQILIKESGDQAEAISTSRHTEIQHELLSLGAEMGLDVWVARNDRSRAWNGVVLGSMPRVINELPTQFNEATNRTIELQRFALA